MYVAYVATSGEEGEQVLEDPAADGAVIGQDHHGDDAGNDADPAPLGVQHLIGGEGALSGLAADSDLGGQQRKTKGQCQNDIGQQENAAAVLGGQIGEAPDVAQTHGRACRGQDKAQRTGEITAFLFHIDQISFWEVHSFYIVARLSGKSKILF